MIEKPSLLRAPADQAARMPAWVEAFEAAAAIAAGLGLAALAGMLLAVLAL